MDKSLHLILFKTRPELYLGHVGQPLQEREDALEVIAHRAVGDAVVVHDLDSAQLVVGRVHFPAQHLEVRREAGGASGG